MKLSQVLSLSTFLTLATSTPIQIRQSSDTENGLTAGGCKAMTVIFARGTTETGNVGTLAGPPFFNALEAKVGAGNVAVQGVDYPADIPGFLAGGDAAGSQKMASLVATAMSQCPSTKVVMAGYRYVFSCIQTLRSEADGTIVRGVNLCITQRR
jgi:cutinase